MTENQTPELTHEQLTQEVIALKNYVFSMSARLDTFQRMLEAKNLFTYDEYFSALNQYQKQLVELKNIYTLRSITERVNKAIEFNSTSDIPILADDLGIIPILESAEGTSVKVAKHILSLKHTKQFYDTLKGFVPEIETEIVSSPLPETEAN